MDCWSVPNFLLIIDYTWHPIYPQKADEQLKQSRKLAAALPPIHLIIDLRKAEPRVGLWKGSHLTCLVRSV